MENTFPDDAWKTGNAAADGWQVDLLNRARQAAADFGSIAATVIHRGAIIAGGGAQDQKVLIRSQKQQVLDHQPLRGARRLVHDPTLGGHIRQRIPLAADLGAPSAAVTLATSDACRERRSMRPIHDASHASLVDPAHAHRFTAPRAQTHAAGPGDMPVQ